MNFAFPSFLLLLLLLPLLLYWYIWRRQKQHASLFLSDLSPLQGLSAGLRVKLRHLLFTLRLLALACLIVALARPQNRNSFRKDTVMGIDIMMAMDISGSMLAMDLQPNRMEAARDVAQRFINNRPTDNIGLVVFSAESFTQCPLTTDHKQLLNRLEEVKPGMLEDGTAIGLGLATAVSRIKDSKAKSKVIILLTDGINNVGDISPLMAASLAKSFGIRIYTIGVGTQGEAPMTVNTLFGPRVQNVPVELDEPTLTKMAEITDGKYFRAVDNESLAEVYHAIDELEKTKIISREETGYEELFSFWAVAAILLLLVEFILRNTYLRSIP
ncbi:aerotolerance regulator BatA [Porphyromonas crevioricanis]|uniref:Mg-chelatase subunit ChlD n=2 Tax=Porphyromonas crevioricanis TaxID=393921 RepID=A0A0A2FGB8_9PORP|nr:VWA domain-containing protein [Porphyromonas crevioricanis]KGN90121.1 aerotolerance regulator BatA [Porphyromonas crevioricanis]SJZ80679.1 Ca-activated chloride channel family protein [Porphyromonas crevioricanis]SQH72515.1 Mg-chelatase subunit ChlD [Porphyromonas crevioricanis]GAD04974.1 batA [Porphyromonas crevioricanis JCM 15906]GAD08546.1 BatA [Porphyromonas crevioricanis JCM 13913]